MTADVIVIGAGASGMMAAYFAAQEGASVLVLDKNGKSGKKLRITGKGRCNLTNNCDVQGVMANIPGDGRFLYSALTASRRKMSCVSMKNWVCRLRPSEAKEFFRNLITQMMSQISCRERVKRAELSFNRLW